MLLSDVVESEDPYTAQPLAARSSSSPKPTADELGVPDEDRQELEFAALLHDVGKIAIPKEILNKPAKLTEEEFEVMKTHTIEGQFLLDRVGGLLGEIGEIVRSCHERWDGQGYPDGLAGEQIPLPARIVFVLRRLQRDDHRPRLPQAPCRIEDGRRRATEQRGHAVRPHASSPPSSRSSRTASQSSASRRRGAGPPRRPARHAGGVGVSAALSRAAGSASVSVHQGFRSPTSDTSQTTRPPAPATTIVVLRVPTARAAPAAARKRERRTPTP